jgi:uncharacterized protein YrzB (UPF0473 family)
MLLNAALLIISGILCLILTVVALIFGVMALANNKPSKFIWLTAFFAGLTGLIICVVSFVRKAVNAVENFNENSIGQFENYTDSLGNYIESNNLDKNQANISSTQIKLLKSYLPANILNNEPEEFYTYLGFKDYNRYPLRYPYSIHCMDSRENGELYNEVNVIRFDENDNGELFAGIGNINKIAFDKNYLLIEQTATSTRTDNLIEHYILFDLETAKQQEAKSLQNLIQLAKEKGYAGSDTLMTLEQYHSLF